MPPRNDAPIAIFDADVHIHERPADLAPFCEMPWRLPLEQDSGNERWLDTPGYSPLTPLDPPRTEDPPPEPTRFLTRDDVLADLADRGVDGALLLTDRFIGLAASQNADYAVCIAAAYNRYLRERWIDPARGLFGAILAATQDPSSAAAEIRANAGAPGVAAILVSTVELFPLFGDRSYDPIHSAAAETGLPVILHGATAYGSMFPAELQSFAAPGARGALAQPLAAIVNLVSLVTSGALARHPTLRVVFCEAGTTWLPFIMGRLDGQHRHLPDLPEPPSSYVRRQVWNTTHPIDGPMDPARVLFASDAPHFDRDRLDALDKLGLSAEDRAQIVVGNARALFPGLSESTANGTSKD